MITKRMFVVVAFIALMVILASMNSRHYVRAFEFHTVQPGETLWSISCDVYDKGFHRDVREIMYDISTDNFISTGKIYPGQILKIQYWKSTD